MEHRKSNSKDSKRAAKAAQRLKTSKAIAKNHGLEPVAIFMPKELKRFLLEGGLDHINARSELASLNINFAISAFLVRLVEQMPIELSVKPKDIEKLIHEIADECVDQGIHVDSSLFKNI